MNQTLRDAEKNLSSRYGGPINMRDGEFHSINQQYFAGLFMLTSVPIYYLPEKTFYLYNRENGLWEPQTEDHMLDLIGNMLHLYSESFAIPDIEEKRTSTIFSSILRLLKGQAENKDAFATRKPQLIHCKNGMLKYNDFTGNWKFEPFSPTYFSRNQNSIAYDKDATCPKFLEKLLKPAMTEDDIELFQLYFGQCLLGVNHSQTFLMLTGTAGGGKSTLVNVLEGVIDRRNCTELRLEHMSGRFEISRTRNKTLLTAKDVVSEFLSSPGALKLKALTGNDMMTMERKNSNDAYDICGNFNIIITSNAFLRVNFDGDAEAWRRRMLWIKYDNPPPKERITDFDRILLREEGSGILNWALTGAAKLLRNKGKISKSPVQQSRIEYLLKSAIPVDVFVRNCVKRNSNSTVTTLELQDAFFRFSDSLGWNRLPERKVQIMMQEAMLSIHNASKRTDVKRAGKNNRGYYGFQIALKNDPTDPTQP